LRRHPSCAPNGAGDTQRGPPPLPRGPPCRRTRTKGAFFRAKGPLDVDKIIARRVHTRTLSLARPAVEVRRGAQGGLV